MTEKEISAYMHKVAGFMIGSVVIWCAIILWQLFAGVITIFWGYGVWTLLLMGYNIFAMIRYMRNIDRIKKVHTKEGAEAVLNYFENSIPVCWLFMFINLIFGGVLGFVGNLYDLILAYNVRKKKYEILAGNDAPYGGEYREIV